MSSRDAAAKKRPEGGQSDMEFKVGDKSVHPHHGVGEVTGIDTKSIAGHKKVFYTLKIVDSGLKVMVATDAAERLGLRKVISKKEASDVMDVLRDKTIAVTSQPWNRRYREYTDMLNSGSPYEVAKVLRDLTVIKVDKDLSFAERGLLDKARTLLVTELAVAKKVNETRVESEIEEILSA